MFKADNWAKAFVNTTKTPLDAEEALNFLKTFCYAALSLPGDLSGKNDADRLGRSIEAAWLRFSEQNNDNAQETVETPTKQNFRLAERFVMLMLRKDCFHHYTKILRSIEKIINKQKGIEEVTVEAAIKLDNELLRDIEAKAKSLLGAREINLTQHLVPDLIGGIRIRWGSKRYDGSIKRGLEAIAGNIKSQIA